MIARPLLLVLLLAGCNRSTTIVDSDGGVAQDGPALADLAGSSSDGSVSADAGGGPPDMTWDPSQAHPPMGATRCGDGTFTDADSKMVCQMSSFLLDYWGMQMTPFPRACDAATITGGSYEVWCTPTQAYVHVRFTGLRATGTLVCKMTTRLMLGVVYESGGGGGDTGITLTSGYGGVPSNDFDVNSPIDAYGWITVAVGAKSANLWLTPSHYFSPCGSMNSGYRSVVGGAHAVWTP
jgi:hypothetical protein